MSEWEIISVDECSQLTEEDWAKLQVFLRAAHESGKCSSWCSYCYTEACRPGGLEKK